MNQNAISSLFHNVKNAGPPQTALQPGQIFRGKILKLYPESHALLQLGSSAVRARLEAPLILNQSYLFQVQGLKTASASDQGESRVPVLKVIEGSRLPGQQNSRPSFSTVLNNLNIPFSKSREAIIRFFVNEGVPFSKEIVESGGEWLKNAKDKQTALDVLRQMTTRELPATKAVFEALYAHKQSPPLYEQLLHLNTLLNKNNLPEPLQPLRNTITNIIAQTDISTSGFKDLFQQLVARLGLQYENDLQAVRDFSAIQKALKPALINALAQPLSDGLKQSVERLLGRLTGQQLNTVTESGQMLTTMMQLPVQFGEHFTDLTIRWEGKKKRNGEIDSDFCRVLFYLELEYLQEIAVDMQIQKRTVSLKIYNENQALGNLIEAYRPVLKQRLETLDYGLSFVKHVKRNVNTERVLTGQTERFNGMDIRV